MKRLRFLVIIAVLMFCSCNIFAQKSEVTKFLGIPIDGTKATMIQKLKAKGFKHNVAKDCLEGEFNGREVTLHVVTNNNKVYRIMVQDAIESDEGDIKIRFNNLCRQFGNNDKYIPIDFEGDFEIKDSEDISYEILVHNKRYQAGYYQVSKDDIDSVEIANVVQQEILVKYTQEQLDNADEKLSEEIQQMAMEIGMNYLLDKISNKFVWFMITKDYGGYRIVMYYDNKYNAANGEDL